MNGSRTSLLASLKTTISFSNTKSWARRGHVTRKEPKKRSNDYAMTVPLRRPNTICTKDLFATLTSTIPLHPIPETHTKSCSGFTMRRGRPKNSTLNVNVSVLSRRSTKHEHFSHTAHHLALGRTFLLTERRKPRNLLHTSSREADCPKTIRL
jgi:hypothetical protein